MTSSIQEHFKELLKHKEDFPSSDLLGSLRGAQLLQGGKETEWVHCEDHGHEIDLNQKHEVADVRAVTGGESSAGEREANDLRDLSVALQRVLGNLNIKTDRFK